MNSHDMPVAGAATTLEDEAAAMFVQRHHGEWTAENQTAFEARLLNEPDFARAYRRVEQSWRALDTHAEAPEVMTYRSEALETMRRANARRWFQAPTASPLAWRGRLGKVAAALVGIAALGTAWQLSPHGYRPGEYRTAIGEQRIVELADHTRITIDAATRLQVRFTDETRTVRLLEGQAQFSVAKDPARPFKVIAGDRTIVAVGTVFTVEYVDRRMQIAMVEGKVAVLPSPQAQVARTPLNQEHATHTAAGRADAAIYLTAGESLHVSNGQTIYTPEADLEAATAWRQGKVIFRTTPLGEAVDRMNRYSQLQLEIEDDMLAAQHISGVFEAGDMLGFVDALEKYLPVNIDYTDADTVRLKLRRPSSSLTADATAPPLP